METRAVPTRWEMSKLALGLGLGGIVEFYDIFIAGIAAALVWPAVFFPWASGSMAGALSIAMFGAFNFLRPVGAYVFGHYGDKIGRRSMMLATLTLMGASVLGVGLLPGYASIGMLSVVLLLIFRMLFGLGVGGEFGGAASWLVEAASRSKWRAFWTLWTQPSTIGSAVGSFSFALVAAFFGRDLVTWGWRIPFVIGALVLVIGIVMRYKLMESPLFQALKEKGQVEKSPAKLAIKQCWKQILLLAGTGFFIFLTGTALNGYYAPAYLVARGIPSSFATFATGVGSGVGSIFLIVGAITVETIGRKRTYLISVFLMMATVLVYVPFLSTLNPLFIISVLILQQGTACIGIATISALFAEYFPTKVRYSASGLSFATSNLFSGLMLSFILPAIIASTGGLVPSAPYMTAAVFAVVVVSLACMLKLRETKGDKMAL